MNKGPARTSLAGLRVTSSTTLLSRVLGMVRDMATASLFGLAGGGVMDAFVVAFRIPNLFRRLFGEGALTASYLPIFSGVLERDHRAAWQLASVTMTWLSAVLAGLVVLGELVCSLVLAVAGDLPGVQLVAGLAATMMPYLLLICLTAQLAATLHALSHFAMPAFAPVVLNVLWLVAVWGVAPRFAPDKVAQAYVLAVFVVIAGVVQLWMQWMALRRHGFRYEYNWQSSRDELRRIVQAMAPMMLGLAATQLNTLLDVLMAWGLSATPESGATIAWLGGVEYPMAQGAAAAVYLGERLYQFPVGVLGVAVATVIFPLLSRHAARGDLDSLGSDLTLGLRLVVLLGLPASVGLVLLAEPIARLLFLRGEFTAEDAERAARMVAAYGTGVWAYCALPVLVRGFYAMGDHSTPMRSSLMVVTANLLLNLSLVWVMAEMGLAVSTAACAMAQVIVLAVVFSRTASRLQWRVLARTATVSLVASVVMGAACWYILRALPRGEGLRDELARVGVPVVVSLAVYLAVVAVARRAELRILWATRERA
ncbi:MAG: murein biosynthesis integral membrane protein MurJ [Pirellulales bacterium]